MIKEVDVNRFISNSVRSSTSLDSNTFRIELILFLTVRARNQLARIDIQYFCHNVSR